MLMAQKKTAGGSELRIRCDEASPHRQLAAAPIALTEHQCGGAPMPAKNPGTEHEQLIEAANSFWRALMREVDEIGAEEQYRVAKCAGEKFAEYANVTDPERFLIAIKNVLLHWAWAISHPKSNHRQLTGLKAEPQFGTETIKITLEIKLWPGRDEDELRYEAVIGLLDRFHEFIAPFPFVERPTGRLAEIDGYPGLAVLIFWLERAAQRAGGKFTIHRKHGEKGTLIRALGELRNLLAMTDWGSSLAHCLPCPNKHPVAKYERIIADARL
jgi:hypothetical protein